MNGLRRGFTWRPGDAQLMDIGALASGTPDTSAEGLGSTGLVTGNSRNDGHTHAILYTPGLGLADLGACRVPPSRRVTAAV